ncbi:hypothetical protein AB205_0136720 [Aquarana catesbeiana]|uniref:CARD domain-containing protein n=1 Tax=Aquarana catesbeiana TaxID=8400 RepID=A0A2G9SH82_AQUCT|nr:hypothetical protein AB205_0136720 [Aquarana catesbeiana]
MSSLYFTLYSSVSLPVTTSTNGSHMLTMGHHPRTERNSRASWTHEEPVGHSNPPPLLRWKNCVETLNRNLEVLLNSITEGHLNQLMDNMRSKSVLSRDDTEYINAEQTQKARIRKYIETCCEKGEEASRMTLDSLLDRKIIYINPV